MFFKVDVERYSKDELEYELSIRGISEPGNVDQLRKCLRSAMTLEKAGQVIHSDIRLDAKLELETCEKKLDEIRVILSTFSGSAGQTKKLETKFDHVFHRIDRITSEDAALVTKRSQLLKQFMDCVSDYTTFTRTLQVTPQGQNVVLDAAIQEDGEGATQSTPNRTLHGLTNIEQDHTVAEANISNSVPVYKWNLKFSGKVGDRLSINAFLLQVEEMCVSRNVSKTQLFLSAMDLFEGDALTWYRVVRRYVQDWNHLVRLMREEFLPPHSSDQLWKQILERTQGANESIGIYVATMTALFERMPITVSDSLRLQVLRKNIIPFYQERLALIEVKTPFELIELCRKLESTRISVECFKPPQSDALGLEPDLAYVDSTKPTGNSTRGVIREIEVRNTEQLCWRCKKEGHLARGCTASVGLQCYSCGLPGYTIRNCPKCSSNSKYRVSGNGSRRRN